MGCVSSNNITSIEVYNASNGDQITILPTCMTMTETKYNINVCQHDLNVKLSKTSTFENYRMDGVAIYKWFESRKHEIPPHFLPYKDIDECNQYALSQYATNQKEKETEKPNAKTKEKEIETKKDNKQTKKEPLSRGISVGELKKAISKKFVILVNGTPWNK